MKINKKALVNALGLIQPKPTFRVELWQKEQNPSCWNSPVMTHEMIMDEQKVPLPEDTLIFRKGVEEGRRLEREDIENEWLEDRGGCFWDGVNEGKKAMKEQMLKDAVEGRVISNDGISFPVSNEIHRLKLIEGDKVKIIIVKEDKK